MNREEALAEIARIAKNFNLDIDDIKEVFKSTPERTTMQSNKLMNTLLAYIGGILIFSGICIFIAMQWDNINTFNRILLTLGVGFCLFISAVFCTRIDGFSKAAGPLFLLAALLQPTGLAVLFHEYFPIMNPIRGVLIISLMMFIQQGFTFISTKRTELALTTIIFGVLFFMAAFELLAIPYKTEWFVLSSSILCLAWVINNSRYQAIASVLFFFGSLAFFLITFDILRNQFYELLYLGLCCFMIFIAIVSSSRTLLINASLATLAYIGYFTGKHFPHTLGWPLTLIVMGFILIIFSAWIIKLNRHYLKT
ncbi:DUF2157 domain-containing protein [Legionella bononiensis]|uniref:DUF2157 domain-containing protein n=1 Tax=Legionella bononiensis TaxID=2793102 RepID=UPI00193228FE|nr:DUF2157 domain-containing protein [Legionella bononiensis]MBL7480788.1 DUF2157 domain-containing protein [Legionella bononiensis]